VLFLGQCLQYGYANVSKSATFANLAASMLRVRFPGLTRRRCASTRALVSESPIPTNASRFVDELFSILREHAFRDVYNHCCAA
jgi:hypothetical protein